MFIFGMLAEIGDRIKQSTAEAFAQLYDQYLPKVFRYMSYRIVDTHMAEDLTSTVFEKALTKFKTYDSEKAGFSTWIFSIARNTLIDHYPHPEERSVMCLWKMPFLFRWKLPLLKTKSTGMRNVRFCRNALNELSAQEQEIISLKFGQK